MQILGENYDEYWGLDEYDPYDPFDDGYDIDDTEAWLEYEMTRSFGDGWK